MILKKPRRIAFGLVLTALLGVSAAWSGNVAQAQPSVKVTTLTPYDYMEIKQLYAAYSHALDSGDGTARTGTFTDDGHFVSHITKHVPETAQSMGARTTSQGRGWSRHLLMNILITPTAEGAQGICYALIVNAKPKGDDVIKATSAVYRDILLKTAKGWRFKERHIWHDDESNSPFQYVDGKAQ